MMRLKATALLGFSLLSLTLSLSPASAMRSTAAAQNQQEAARPQVPAGKIVSREEISKILPTLNKDVSQHRRIVRQLLRSLTPKVLELPEPLRSGSSPETLNALYHDVTAQTFGLRRDLAKQLFDAFKDTRALKHTSRAIATEWWQELTCANIDVSFALVDVVTRTVAAETAPVQLPVAPPRATSTSHTRPLAPSFTTSVASSSMTPLEAMHAAQLGLLELQHQRKMKLLEQERDRRTDEILRGIEEENARKETEQREAAKRNAAAAKAATAARDAAAAASRSRPVAQDVPRYLTPVEQLTKFCTEQRITLYPNADILGYIDSSFKPAARQQHQSRAQAMALLRFAHTLGYSPTDADEQNFLNGTNSFNGSKIRKVKDHIAKFLLDGGKDRIQNFLEGVDAIIELPQTIDYMYDVLGDLGPADRNKMLFGAPLYINRPAAFSRRNIFCALRAGFQAADAYHRSLNVSLEPGSSQYATDLEEQFLTELQAAFPQSRVQDIPQILARAVMNDDDFLLPPENAQNLQKIFYGAYPYSHDRFPGLTDEAQEVFTKAFLGVRESAPSASYIPSGPIIEELDPDDGVGGSASGSRAITDGSTAEMRGALVLRRASQPYGNDGTR